MAKPKVAYTDLGIISYNEAWDYQKNIQQNIIANKREGDKHQTSHLIFCEHKPVYTLGKSGKLDHLVYTEAELARQGIEFYKTNRGGDITYHGPGQITGYPVFDLDQYYNDVHRYVRELEEVVIRTLSHFGITGQRIDGFTGVWLPPNGSKYVNRKICAIGVHMSRWVSLHGFALNVNTELDHFDGIVPCGIVDNDKAVTSINKELEDQTVTLDEVKAVLKLEFSNVFQFEYSA